MVTASVAVHVRIASAVRLRGVAMSHAQIFLGGSDDDWVVVCIAQNAYWGPEPARDDEANACARTHVTRQQ